MLMRERRKKIRYEIQESKDKSCIETALAVQPPKHSQNCLSC